MTLEARLLATLFEQDSFFTDYGLRKDFEDAFGALEDDTDFKALVGEFRGDDTLIAFDLEQDGISNSLLDHNEYGSIDGSEISVLSGETYLALGPAFPIRLQRNLYRVAEAAADGALSEALRLLKLMPIDSSGWTGEVSELRFTPEVQSKVIGILQRARSSMNEYDLSNAQMSKVLAYIDSAILLADLPEPEPDLVRVLIQKIALIVGVVGFVADLKSLLWTS